MELKTSAWLLITSQTPRREKLHPQGVQGHPDQYTCRTRLPGTAALHAQGWCACQGHTMAWPAASTVNIITLLLAGVPKKQELTLRMAQPFSSPPSTAHATP